MVHGLGSLKRMAKEARKASQHLQTKNGSIASGWKPIAKNVCIASRSNIRALDSILVAMLIIVGYV